jgi:predicted transcriptional regulator
VIFLGKNRDGLTIVAAIVEAAGSGSTKTRIMISANLSFKLLEKYLDVAVQAGFVSASNSKYHLTDSGREFILNYRSLRERYVYVQKLLEALSSERESLWHTCDGPNVDRM